MSTIVAIFFIGVFMAFIAWGIIKTIIDEIRTHSFILVEAKIIDKVDEYTKEWGKYFPDLYKKATKLYNLSDKLGGNKNEINEEKDKVFICEYTVNKKKYYYAEVCPNNASLKRYLNKTIEVKYDPKKPEYVIKPKIWYRKVLMLLFFEAIFVLILFLLISD